MVMDYRGDHGSRGSRDDRDWSWLNVVIMVVRTDIRDDVGIAVTTDTRIHCH